MAIGFRIKELKQRYIVAKFKEAETTDWNLMERTKKVGENKWKTEADFFDCKQSSPTQGQKRCKFTGDRS